MNVFVEVKRLGLVCMGFIRLDDNEPVDDIIKASQPKFQKLQLVEERKAIVNLHCGLPVWEELIMNAVDCLSDLRTFY